jgi:hypothetical protein
MNLLLEEILVDAGTAVPLTALLERCAHEHAQPPIGLRVHRFGPLTPRVEPARRDIERPT